MIRIHTILHPTDFSDSSEHALAVARSLARDHQARLVLLTVPTPPPPAGEVYVPDEQLAQMMDEARQRLAGVAARITEIPVETRVISGEPGWSIVTAARDCRADLIVMGTHGRTGLTRLLLGSIAEHVLRHAPCPVLTIKPGTDQHLQDEQPTSLVKNG